MEFFTITIQFERETDSLLSIELIKFYIPKNNKP